MKRFTLRGLVLVIVVTASGFVSRAQIAPGIYTGDWNSFINNYQCPEWFRDAKFGIWAHWTAQCQPEQGDWYARNMYLQGWGQYNSHVSKYGHPTTFGFMEIINQWKAQNWNPDSLMKLYQYAGAKYFVTLANHHDNFDNYDSKYQDWNSVKVGPKKDIVGTWEKIARKYGMRFGVSNHSAHAWHWFQTAYGYDPTGAKAGQRYDAYTLTKAQGAGKWWEGLDPQDLYCGLCASMKMPDGLKTTAETDAWHQAHDRSWNEAIPACNPQFADKWFLRCKDLVDKYKPDLLYFDDFGLPLEQKGKDMVAHFYNSSIAWNGKNQAVVNAKLLSGNQPKGIVEDIERGFSATIRSSPWQTCTCIGDWHYSASKFTYHQYKTVSQVVLGLVDIVSKNGNLLLSIPMKGDGTIDADELAFLKGMGAWMQMNGEAIYGTRPWTVYGEGPTVVKEGMMNEGSIPFTSTDFRFTCKDKTVYAFAFAWPTSKQYVITSLGTNTTKDNIESITLLGYNGTITWTRNATGLTINVPATRPGNYANAFKITLAGAVPQSAYKGTIGAIPGTIQFEDYDIGGNGYAYLDKSAGNSGSTTFRADEDLDIETCTDAGGGYNVGYATAGEWMEYTVNVATAGKYNLNLRVACNGDGRTLSVSAKDVVVAKDIAIPNTTGWQVWQDVRVPGISLSAGVQVIRVTMGATDYVNLNYMTFSVAPSVTITAPQEGAVYSASDTVAITANATVAANSTIANVKFYDGTILLSTDLTAPYTASLQRPTAGSHAIKAVVTDNFGNTSESIVNIKVNPAQVPYGGTAWPIPGKIELENYDIGGNNFAYSDKTTGNTGGASFRTDEDVDVEACTDAGTGYNVGYFTAGEWMEYTVNVIAASTYDITLRVACNGDGRTVSISAKDVVIAKDIAIPNTAGWQTWQDVKVSGIHLDAGTQVLRLTMGATDYVNLNNISFAATATLPVTINLKTGWNLVGYPYTTSKDLAVGLASVWSAVSVVKNLDGFYDKTTAPALNSLSKLEYGKGYYVKVNKDCVLSW